MIVKKHVLKIIIPKFEEGEEGLSGRLARRGRRAVSKKSPGICRSDVRQSRSDSGAGALPSLRNFDALLRSVLLLLRNPRRIGHDRGAGRRFDILLPSRRESGSELRRDCSASLPLPHKLYLVPLRQIPGDFLLTACAPPRPHNVTPRPGHAVPRNT